MTCDHCGNIVWHSYYPDVHPRAFKIFGPNAHVCSLCGAVRYPKELETQHETHPGPIA